MWNYFLKPFQEACSDLIVPNAASDPKIVPKAACDRRCVVNPWHFGTDSDPHLRLMDPDPAIFVSDLQDGNKKLLFLLITFWR
jgi:hypothetical protein